MLSLLKKISPDNLKALTEEEIQQKLYGYTLPKKHLLPPSTASVGATQPQPVAIKDPVETADAGSLKERVIPKRSSPIGRLRELVREGKRKITDYLSWTDKTPLVVSVSTAIVALLLVAFLIRVVGFLASPKKKESREVARPAVTSTAVKNAQDPATGKAVPASTLPTEGVATQRPLAEPLKSYTIQIAVYEDERLASARVNELVQKGLPAFYHRFQTKKGRLQFQICIGRYPTYKEAQLGHQRYQTLGPFKEFPDSFVKILKE